MRCLKKNQPETALTYRYPYAILPPLKSLQQAPVWLLCFVFTAGCKRTLEYMNVLLCLTSWLTLFYSHHSRVAPFLPLSVYRFPDEPSDLASCIFQTQLHNPPLLRLWSAWWLGYTSLLDRRLWTTNREEQHSLSQRRPFLCNCSVFIHDGPDPTFLLQTSPRAQKELCLNKDCVCMLHIFFFVFIRPFLAHAATGGFT